VLRGCDRETGYLVLYRRRTSVHTRTDFPARQPVLHGLGGFLVLLIDKHRHL
jgi:hypothetical protein